MTNLPVTRGSLLATLVVCMIVTSLFAPAAVAVEPSSGSSEQSFSIPFSKDVTSQSIPKGQITDLESGIDESRRIDTVTNVSVFDQAVLPLRPDVTESNPTSDEFINFRINNTRSFASVGGAETALNKDEVYIYNESATIETKYNPSVTGETPGLGGTEVQLITARLNEGGQIPTTFTEAGEFITSSDDSNATVFKNQSIDPLNSNPDFSFSVSESGQFIFAVAVIENSSRNGLVESGSGNLTAQSEVTIVGFDQFLVSNGRSDITLPSNRQAGQSISVRANASALDSTDVSHTVAIFNETTLESSQDDRATNITLDDREVTEIDSSIGPIVGAADTDPNTNFVGSQLGGNRFLGSTSIQSLIELFTGTREDVTDIRNNNVTLYASVNGTVGDETEDITVRTNSSFDPGEYTVLHFATEQDNTRTIVNKDSIQITEAGELESGIDDSRRINTVTNVSVFDQAVLPLRPDVTESNPTSDEFINFRINNTRSFASVGGAETALNKDEVYIYNESATIETKYNPSVTGETPGLGGTEVQLITARLNEGGQIPTTFTEAGEFITSSDDSNATVFKNQSIDPLNSNPDFSFSVSESGQFIFAVAVIENSSRNGLVESGSGNLTAQSEVTIVGFDQFLVSNGRSDITLPSNRQAGQSISVRANASALDSTDVSHTVAIFNETTLENSQDDRATNITLDDREVTEIDSSIGPIVGAADTDPNTNFVGSQLGGNRFLGSTSIQSLIELFTGTREDVTDIRNNNVTLYASVNGTVGDETEDITVRTNGSFDPGEYTVLHFATEQDNTTTIVNKDSIQLAPKIRLTTANIITPGPVTPDDIVRVSAEINNTGNTSEDIDLALREDGNRVDSTEVTIDPDETVTAELAASLPEGTQTLTVQLIDPDDFDDQSVTAGTIRVETDQPAPPPTPTPTPTPEPPTEVSETVNTTNGQASATFQPDQNITEAQVSNLPGDVSAASITVSSTNPSTGSGGLPSNVGTFLEITPQDAEGNEISVTQDVTVSTVVQDSAVAGISNPTLYHDVNSNGTYTQLDTQASEVSNGIRLTATTTGLSPFAVGEATNITTQRSLTQTEVTNGSTVTVTVSAAFDSAPERAELDDTISGSGISEENISLIDDNGGFGFISLGPEPTVDVVYTDRGGFGLSNNNFTVEYEVTIPADIPAGTTITFDGTVTNSDTGGTVTISGESQIEVIPASTSVSVGGEEVPVEFTSTTEDGERTVTADDAVDAIDTFIAGEISADIAVDVIDAFRTVSS